MKLLNLVVSVVAARNDVVEDESRAANLAGVEAENLNAGKRYFSVRRAKKNRGEGVRSAVNRSP